jgi:hypothetical protein
MYEIAISNADRMYTKFGCRATYRGICRVTINPYVLKLNLVSKINMYPHFFRTEYGNDLWANKANIEDCTGAERSENSTVTGYKIN